MIEIESWLEEFTLCKPHGPLDRASSESLERIIVNSLSLRRHVIVDFLRVPLVDDDGLIAIMMCARHARSTKGSLQIRNVRPSIAWRIELVTLGTSGVQSAEDGTVLFEVDRNHRVSYRWVPPTSPTAHSNNGLRGTGAFLASDKTRLCTGHWDEAG